MRRIGQFRVVALCCAVFAFVGCKSNADAEKAEKTQPPSMSSVAVPPAQIAVDALPAEKTGGFDGKAAFDHVAKMVSFGPRPAGSQAIAQTQDYILSQLQTFGCTVETDAFTASTPVGPVPMRNIIVKIPGDRSGVILLGTHYDTLKMENF